MSADGIQQWANIAAAIVTAFGLPAALFSYRHRKQQELKEFRKHREAEQATNDDLAFDRQHGDYINYLAVAMQYPELDMGEEPLKDPPELSDMQRVQAAGLFNIFISISERAYRMYARASRDARTRQWTGWEVYIVEQLQRPNFAAFFATHKDQYDADFITEICKHLDAPPAAEP